MKISFLETLRKEFGYEGRQWWVTQEAAVWGTQMLRFTVYRHELKLHNDRSH